jgi:hypothetical protein
VLEDSRRQEIASVTRGFRGWGREVSSDKTRGRASVVVDPAPPHDHHGALSRLT